MKTKTSIYHRTFAFAYVLLVAVLFTGCADVTPIKECVVDTPYRLSVCSLISSSICFPVLNAKALINSSLSIVNLI